MRKTASIRAPGFNWTHPLVAAGLVCFLIFVLLSAHPAHALDPNKRLTQYMHTSWRIQDGSLPSGMYQIRQSSDAFLWLLSLPGDIYRFDGVQLLPWHLPAGISSKVAVNIYAAADGLWVLGPANLYRVKNGLVTYRSELHGEMFQGFSEDRDGSLWVLQRNPDAPLCRVSNTLKCLGKADGMPVSSFTALLSDGNGGFWLGGENALVHWRAGVSETYRIEGSKPGVGIQSLARGSDGSLWVGTDAGLRQFNL